MLAAFAAVLSPLRAVLSRDPLAATGDARASRAARALRMALSGLACLVAASALLAVEPDAAIPGMVLVIAALLCLLPLALAATLALTGRLARLFVSPVSHLARMELSAGRARAMAIAATGAMAVFGSVAIQGARRDLLAGLRAAARETSATAQVWVAPSRLLQPVDDYPVCSARADPPAPCSAVCGRSGSIAADCSTTASGACSSSPRPSRAGSLLPLGQLLGVTGVRQAERRSCAVAAGLSCHG